MTEKICVVCGKPFEAIGCRRVTCSYECSAEHDRRRNERRREEEKLRRGAKPPVICAVCGSPFVPSRSTQKVCGAECARERNERLQREAKARKAAQRPPAKRGRKPDKEKKRERDEAIKRMEAERAERAEAWKNVPWPKSMIGLSSKTVCCLAKQKGMSYGQFVATYITPEVERDKRTNPLRWAKKPADELAAEELMEDLEVARRTFL